MEQGKGKEKVGVGYRAGMLTVVSATETAKKRVHGLALHLRLRRRNPAGYPLPVAGNCYRPRLRFQGEAGAD